MISTTIGSSRLLIAALSLATIALAAFLAHSEIRLTLATSLAATIEQARIDALASEPTEAADGLRYIVGHYPSGTLQLRGSRLDRLVELQRAAAIREIIAHLRDTTQENLRDDPGPWISKFATKR
jgi:hypothetical protein